MAQARPRRMSRKTATELRSKVRSMQSSHSKASCQQKATQNSRTERRLANKGRRIAQMKAQPRKVAALKK